jgi:hypothetical protein
MNPDDEVTRQARFHEGDSAENIEKIIVTGLLAATTTLSDITGTPTKGYACNI